jgi:serine/threonine protein kinase
MPLQTGQMLVNRYRIVRLLGQGGFGAVYRAWDSNLTKACAVKENLDTSPEAHRQFSREATVLANLSHPNMPRVTDHFSIPGQGQYLVMDFVEGEDLATLVQRLGPVPVQQALEWIPQVADALIYLHSRQPPVLHRDIKPANIRINTEGKAMLVDFGLVKLYDPHLKTTIGARAVTPGYAPPEQYGQGKTDVRTDVYALGATLYNILTAQEPLESVQRMVGRPMPTAEQANSQVPMYLSQTIEHAMALEPEHRFQSAAEFKAALVSPSRAMPVMSSVLQAEPYDSGSTLIVSQAGESQAEGVHLRPAMQGDLRISPPQARIPSAEVSSPPQVITGPRPKANRLAMIIGVVALAILCIGVAIGLGGWIYGKQQLTARATALQGTLVERVKTTSTAKAKSTSSSNTQATSTALAQLLVTQQSLDNYVAGLLASRNQVYGSKNGSLYHNQSDSSMTSDDTSVNIKNFILEVRLFNPYAASTSPWDYGIIFRSVGINNQYRLVIKSDKTWKLLNNTGNVDGSQINYGDIPNLDDSERGSNFIRLICQDGRGLLYVNGAYVSELNLSVRQVSGDILIATGIFFGDEKDGKSTDYQGLTIWSIP